MSYVRISLGRFDAGKYDTIRQKLIDSQKTLVPAMKALNGNVAFYAGIDRENSAMSNVSVWETLEDAQQMDSLKPMLDLAKEFLALGMVFERPITNHEIEWAL